MDMRIYVACLASYNNGCLHGRWIDADSNVDVMQEQVNARHDEIEREWLDEGATYFYYVRSIFYAAGNPDNATGGDEVLFCACINTDFEYGRDRIPRYSPAGGSIPASHWVYERNVKLADITPDLLNEILGDIGVALARKA